MWVPVSASLSTDAPRNKAAKNLARYLLVYAIFALVLSNKAIGQELAAPPYVLTPSDVRIPRGMKMGEFQRTIRPFNNWTLICDDDLAADKTVCNVKQTFSDRNGTLVFSWALAITGDGKPYMFLRTAPSADKNGFITVAFEGRERPLEVYFDGCNHLVCVAMLPVGPIMREQIFRKASPKISYPTTNGKIVSVTAILDGLSEALKAVE